MFTQKLTEGLHHYLFCYLFCSPLLSTSLHPLLSPNSLHLTSSTSLSHFSPLHFIPLSLASLRFFTNNPPLSQITLLWTFILSFILIEFIHLIHQPFTSSKILRTRCIFAYFKHLTNFSVRVSLNSVEIHHSSVALWQILYQPQ